MITTEPGRILVTGAAGFVGRALVAWLLDAFPSTIVHALQREVPVAGADSRRVHLVRADLLRDDLAGILASARPDVVVHLAAISSVQQSLGPGASAFEDNLTAGLRLLKAMEQACPGAALVFASSGEVYGRSFLTTPVAREDTPIFPNNPYARSKAALEFAVQDMFCAKGRAVILRLFNHFGEGQDARFVVASFAEQLEAVRRGAPPVIRVGNLSAERDFLPLADVLPAYGNAIRLAHGLASGRCEVFNVASGRPRSIRSVLDDLIEASGLAVTVETDPARMRPAEITRAAGDPQRFQDATGWLPAADWSQALSALLRA